MISKKENLKEDEINLIGIVFTIWDYKFKIFLITFLSVIAMLGYQKSKNILPSYLVSTEIRPISNFDSFEYTAYNSYANKLSLNNIISKETLDLELLENELKNLEQIKPKEKGQNLNFVSTIEINQQLLLKFFLTSINDRSYLEELIRKFNYLKKEDYKSLELYEKAIKDMSSSIKLLSPKTSLKENENDNKYWYIEFKTKDLNKWQEFLKYINTISNERTQKYLESYFEQFFKNKKNLKKLMIEDIETDIINTLEVYKTRISRRLIYLEEQAKIARKLNIAKRDLIESQSFRTDTGVITSLTTEIPYYMRGYDMIEKEIELIKNRTNNKAFAIGIENLEIKKKDLISNKDTERLEVLFLETPIKKESTKFLAAKIMFQSPLIQMLDNKISLKKILTITFLISLIFAIFYALTVNALKNRK